MNARFRITIILFSLICVGTAHSSYDVNKDLKNLGPNAHDLTVRLSGTETVTNHFDGYTSGPKRGHFGTFAHGPSGANTDMRWNNFDDGTDNIINTNQIIHVGWSTSDHSSHVLDMWWTDVSGNRIQNSTVFNIISGWTYVTTTQTVNITWDNIFLPDPAHGQLETVSISNVQYAVLATPIALANLNGENDSLAAMLQPLPGGTSFDVPYKNQSVALSIPGSVPENSAVVLRYEVSAPGTDAETVDFVQFIATPAPRIPSLNQWGMIVLGALLAVSAVWVFLRKRRTAIAI